MTTVMNNKLVSQPVGCLFPMCSCITGRLGCAYEPYDMRREWDGEQYDTQVCKKDFERQIYKANSD